MWSKSHSTEEKCIQNLSGEREGPRPLGENIRRLEGLRVWSAIVPVPGSPDSAIYSAPAQKVGYFFNA
jgi:hypothetical protein